jgi:hypothetical protein
MWEDSTERYNPIVGSVGSGMYFFWTHRSLDLQGSLATVADPTENVKGMYRLLDLICDTGSNGYGKGHLLCNRSSRQSGLIA